MHTTFWPRTRIGWVAALAFDAFIVLYIINGFMIKLSSTSAWWLTSVLPYYGIVLMLTVVMASAGSVIALLIGRDQAWAVRMATLPIVVWVGVHMMIFVLNVLHL
jgi:hypothetical protein